MTDGQLESTSLNLCAAPVRQALASRGVVRRIESADDFAERKKDHPRTLEYVYGTRLRGGEFTDSALSMAARPVTAATGFLAVGIWGLSAVVG